MALPFIYLCGRRWRKPKKTMTGIFNIKNKNDFSQARILAKHLSGKPLNKKEQKRLSEIRGELMELIIESVFNKL
jgi:hypothetical protein